MPFHTLSAVISVILDAVPHLHELSSLMYNGINNAAVSLYFKNCFNYKLQIVYLLYSIHTVKEYKIILLKHDAKLF